MLSMFPSLPDDSEKTAGDMAKLRQQLYQRCLAVLLLCLELCAERGIKVVHRCIPVSRRRIGAKMRPCRGICLAYACPTT